MTSKNTIDSVIDAGDALDLSFDIDDMLASFSSVNSNEKTSQTNPTGRTGRSHKRINPDKRRHHRHLVQWRVAIVNKMSSQHDIYHGRTNDVSLSGINILLEHNKSFASDVTVLIAIPPLRLGQKETIVEVQCSLTHSVLDSVHGQFRLGMIFNDFKGDGEKVLADILSMRPIPKKESYTYTPQKY